jgi:hypothetical protein
LFPSVIGQAIQDELQVLEKNVQVIILTLGNQSRNPVNYHLLDTLFVTGQAGL